MTDVQPDRRDLSNSLDDAPEPFDFQPARDLPGAVLMIPNRHWGFVLVTGDDHPGACLDYSELSRQGVLLQGTDAAHVCQTRLHYIVEPTTENGLQKRTAFRLVPRYFRAHRLRLYFPERHIGRLDGATLLTLRDELARLYTEE